MVILEKVIVLWCVVQLDGKLLAAGTSSNAHANGRRERRTNTARTLHAADRVATVKVSKHTRVERCCTLRNCLRGGGTCQKEKKKDEQDQKRKEKISCSQHATHSSGSPTTSPPPPSRFPLLLLPPPTTFFFPAFFLPIVVCKCVSERVSGE